MGGGHARTAPAEGGEESPCSGLSLRTSKMLMVQWGRSWRLDRERASERARARARERERESFLLERETRDWRCRSLRNENSEKGEGEEWWGLGVCRCRVEKLRGFVLVD